MQAVVFDMDGLMFDTERLYLKAWDYVGEKVGIPNLKEAGLKTLGLNMEMTIKTLQDEFGPEYDIPKFFDYSREFFASYYLNNHVPVKKGLYNLLNYLKENHYKMAVASSTARKTVLKHLEDAQITEYFDAVVCGDMIRKSKPEPDIYIKACEELQLKPAECYALEDSRNGLLSAYASGCKAIMIPDLWQPDEEIEHMLTAKLQDLDEMIVFLQNK